MNLLKKKWLIYKNLMTYLVVNQNKKKRSNFARSYKSIKFEIKLYLIALSFNRFIFNFDKMLFILCIITNFLYFLAFKSPRVLFFGEYNTNYAAIFSGAAKRCNQLYYDKTILPGSIANIVPVEEYYAKWGKELFTKHLDCIISFFCNPIEQELLEARSLCIPIIGLVELKAKNLDAITYPLICLKDFKTLYFFANYFSKILISSKLEPKNKIHKRKTNNLKHYTKKTNISNIKRNYSSFCDNQNKSYKEQNLTSNNIVLINNQPFFYLFNTIFSLSNYREVFSLHSEYPTLQIPKIMAEIHFTNRNLSNVLKKKKANEVDIFRSRFLNLFKAFNKRIYPFWYLRKKKLKQQYKRRGKNKISFAIFMKNENLKRKNNLKRAKLKKPTIKKAAVLSISDFDFKTWSNNLRESLKVKNIYGNRSLTDRDKKFFLREYIISNLKTFNITTRILKLRHQVISTNYPYIEKYVKKVFEPKPYRPKLAKDIIGSWEYRKWKLFTVTEIPKKKKRIKRLKLFWKLYWLIKLQKRGSVRKYIYTKRVRSAILKKKVLMKKLVEYYYAFAYGRKIKSIITFSNKKKNQVTIVSGQNLMNVFESHLSVFVLRCKFASNMLDCKSLITRGKILVNGKIVYNPGYILNKTDIVQLRSNEVNNFYNKFLKINKPKRWKKNRYFYRLSMRNPVSKRLLMRTNCIKRLKIRIQHLFPFFKFDWRIRKFSLDTFRNFFIGTLTTAQRLKLEKFGYFW